MEKYRTSSHSRFDLKYHFVWITKYRKPILVDVVGARVRELVREVCRTNEIEILEGSVSRDHVHVLLSCPPSLSPSKIMQYIKGKSSRKLLMEFKHLQKMYWGRHLWARGYFVASSGNVTDEVIQEYIRQQEGTEPETNHPRIRGVLQAHIVEVNGKLASFESIKYFEVVPTPMTVEGGELTASLKVKRKVVVTKYAELVEAMYSKAKPGAD